MGLRQEVMDFTTTYKALTPTSQDQYYREKAEAAKRKRLEEEQMDAVDKARVEERRRQVEGGTTDRSGTPTAIPSPFTAVPPGAVAAPPVPTTSTFATAFDTGWPQVRRGGMIRRGPKRYAAGGTVDPLNAAITRNEEVAPGSTDPSDPGGPTAPSDADLIVQQFLGPKGTAAQQINKSIEEPWPLTGPLSEWDEQGTTERLRQEKGTRDVQALDTQSFAQQPQVEPKSRLRRALDVVDKAVGPDPFAVGEGRARRKARLEARQVEPGLTEELPDAEYRRREAEAARLRGEIGASAKRQQDEALSNLNLPALPDLPAITSSAVDVDGYPIGPPVRQPDGTWVPGANKEGPVVPPQGSQDPPRAVQTTLRPSSDPRVVTGDVDPATAPARPSPYPTVALPDAPTGAPDKRSTQYGPGTEAPSPAVTPVVTTPPAATAPAKPSSTAGTSTPGGSGGSAAPPPGGASANAPSSARKEDPRTRTAAFDPDRERPDPTTGVTPARDLDAAGNVVYPSPQEMQQVVTGATAAMPARGGEVVGNGAVSRANFDGFIRAHNPGGKLTKGQALMVGMTSRYQQLLAKGRIKEAAAMAWGLIQAANLEAASFGEVAKDQLRRGDITGATQSVVQGLDLTPDGMGHRAVPGGIETFDPKTGRVTNFTKMDGQTALKIALGMSDGSMLFSALQKAAVLAAPPDKDAQGRQLRDELTRLRIAREQQRLAAGPGGGRGGGGGKAPVAKTAEEQELDKIYGAPPG